MSASAVDPMLFSKCLQYYKRRDVQEAILRHAENREISPRYGEGFGKRPDTIAYPQDVLEFAKRKCTSFHASEERWSNPLDIKTGSSRKELNELRIGWDLVLDIDAKDWNISRLTAWLFIETLKYHGIRKSISCKFSGNKGWHIGVPFEAFPSEIWDDTKQKDISTKDLFPELPRAIANFLLEFMSKPENGIITIQNDTVRFGWTAELLREHPWLSNSAKSYTFQELGAIIHKDPSALLENFCPLCNKVVAADDATFILACPKPDCLHRLDRQFSGEDKALLDDTGRVCPKCKYLMEFQPVARKGNCSHVKSGYRRTFKLTEIIQVDTVLLASRHLYRMAYSLHEKSGLASVVINPDDVLEFDKTRADPRMISLEKTFIDPTIAVRDEAANLVREAWTRALALEEKKQAAFAHNPEFEILEDAVPEEHFPPCMKNILLGMQDGKKRAMFALTNFLSTCAWTPDMIEKRLYDWNKENEKFGDPLREVIIKGHMHQVKLKRERMLPPNCKSFYQELGVCKPDEFCSRSKNPAQYGIKHVKLGEPIKKPKKSKTQEPAEGEKISSEEQKGGKRRIKPRAENEEE